MRCTILLFHLPYNRRVYIRKFLVSKLIFMYLFNIKYSKIKAKQVDTDIGLESEVNLASLFLGIGVISDYIKVIRKYTLSNYCIEKPSQSVFQFITVRIDK